MKMKHSLTAFASLLFLLMAQMPLTASAQLPDFTELAEKNAPAVVNISTKKSSKPVKKFHTPRDNKPEIPEDSPLNELFEHFFGIPNPEGMPDRFFNNEAMGSGFIISTDGYVLTNYHVVSGSDEIIVRLSDRREFTAKLIGSDKASDMALVKIDADNLPVVTIGKGKDLKVGEWVLAIGSPFGFDHSVTAGIVSAKGRSLPTENYVPYIQTDVAINPGNSGGPLFNLEGEVVGINSQIYSRTGGFMGLSFSIPIEVAMNVADQLRTKGKVTRGWLGVLIQDVTRSLAESFGMQQPHGALVAQVIEGSPAQKAGVQVGDIIVSFNDQTVKRSSSLPPMVGSSSVDQPARVVVLRHGEKMTLSVNIGELQDDQLASAAASGSAKDGAEGELLGLAVKDLNAEERKTLDVADGGVIVSKVTGDAAREAGIQVGQVIVMLQNHKIENVADFREQVKKLQRGKPAALLVQEKGGSRWLTLAIPEK
ncbi:MAG: DegQ family serine endoprotease [Pseudomonadota bacterium]|nr:DegQ family serine endoprotease [Pseudomonadota bacterium]